MALSFTQLGYNDPNNYGAYTPGNLTTKKGQGNALALLFGQQQANIRDTSQRVNAGRTDLQSRYGDISGGKYAGITPEDSSFLDSLSQQVRSNNSPEAMGNYASGVLTPLRGAFNVARSKAANRVARTGNSAGYGSLLSDLARQEGQQSAQAGYDIGNEQYKRNTDMTSALTGLTDTRFRREDAGFGKQMSGIEGLANLYGIDANFLSQLRSGEANTLQQGSAIEERRKGKLGNIMGGVNIARGILGG